MKGGTIRRIASKFSEVFSTNKAHQYPDPVLSANQRGMPHSKKPRARRGRKHDVRPMIRRGHLCAPLCEIGTIAYHDKLVKHFGARKARKLHRMAMLQPELVKDLDFSAHPPWAHLRKGSGAGSEITSDG
jgi:hypothetical protein